mmetsp:Transcript_98008/g.280376  ORF Transcript_98008/g.280376 Transcript_98008/m.280376 type:complete len:135 (+) Transcript_98008:396-800(+)
MTDWREGHKSECKKLIAEKSKIKYEMGGVEVPGPGDPRWANPTPADREAARQALASGMRPEDATNGGNPMLGGHMLGLEMEAMLDAPGGDEPASQESLDELAGVAGVAAWGVEKCYANYHQSQPTTAAATCFVC